MQKNILRPSTADGIVRIFFRICHWQIVEGVVLALDIK
jgi:hypothetical protein